MASRRGGGGGGFLFILLSPLSSFFVFLACIFRSSMDVSDASVLVPVSSCHRSSSQFSSICTVRLGPEIPAASRYSSPTHRCRNGVFPGLLVLLCLPEVQHLFRGGGKLRVQPVSPKSTARLDGLESPFDILPVYQVQAASQRG